MDWFIILLFFFFMFVLYMMARNSDPMEGSGYYGSSGYDDYDYERPRSGGFNVGWDNSSDQRRNSGGGAWFGGTPSRSSNRYRHTSSVNSTRSTSRRYNSPSISSRSGFGGSSRRTFGKTSSSGRASSSRPVKSTPRRSFSKKSFKK